MKKTYPVKVGHEYKHFRGKTYKVLFVATDSITNKPVVVYRGNYGDCPVFVIPAESFCDQVERNGYKGPRFMEIKR